MQEERKTSMGSAIVDVFDAGVALVKAEINSLAHKVGELAKAKGIGVLLLLGALAPLSLALIFLILAIYFGLVALGLPWWGAALIMFLGSLAIAGVLVALGLNKLSQGIGQEHRALTEDERLEAEYLAEQRRQRNEGKAPVTGAVVATGVPVSVGHAQTPAAHYDRSAAGSSVMDRSVAQVRPAADVRVTEVWSAGAASAPSLKKETPDMGGLRPAAASGSAVAGGPDARLDKEAAPSGMEQPSVEGAYAVPVYEAGADGAAQHYGQGLNEKLPPQNGHGHDHSHDHEHDPNVVHPEVLEGAPAVRVSTQPTYADDMNRADQGQGGRK